MTPLLFATLLGTLTLTACSSGPVKDASNGSENNGATTGTIGSGGASTVNEGSSTFNYLPGSDDGLSNDANDTSDLSLAGLNDPNNLLSQRIIYFDYNQSTIRPEYMVLINTHAKLAAKFVNLRMRLEGHADERGSREYNVALSEARAQTVRRLMGIQGASSRQIKTIAYGEEVPVVTGHSKNSWQKNRRVEIKYTNN